MSKAYHFAEFFEDPNSGSSQTVVEHTKDVRGMYGDYGAAS